jgi:hypothetical protein
LLKKGVSMQNMRAIEIDFDVHKRLETERMSFSETANETLRRILGIESQTSKTAEAIAPQGRPWSGKGVELPHGTELKMDYNGRQHVGVVKNGVWVVEGGEYTSPSAACGVARTKDGRSTPLDGWKYWHAKQPGQSRWTLINKYRNR